MAAADAAQMRRGGAHGVILARFIRFVVGALALASVDRRGAGAAQQPSTVNPTASSVKEQQLLQELNRIQGRVSIPDQRSSVLEQPAGRDWRNSAT